MIRGPSLFRGQRIAIAPRECCGVGFRVEPVFSGLLNKSATQQQSDTALALGPAEALAGRAGAAGLSRGGRQKSRSPRPRRLPGR